MIPGRWSTRHYSFESSRVCPAAMSSRKFSSPSTSAGRDRRDVQDLVAGLLDQDDDG
jgi:hypothetical protein